MKTKFLYAIEAYHHSKKSVLSLIAGLGFVWGIFNNLLSMEIALCVLSVLSVIVLLFTLYKYTSWYLHVYNGRMMVPIFGKRKVTLLRDDFQSNMASLLCNSTCQEMRKFAFVMGIDRTGNLSISSEGGVVYSVLKHLNDNYVCGQEEPITFIQKELDKYLENYAHVDELNKLAYGTCVEVNLELTLKDKEKADIVPCNLILIANSRKEVPNDKNREERMLDDDKSNIIVPKVFDYLLSTNRYTGVMIGVMGTNGMGQSYQVVFSQIINQFARICFDRRPCSLVNLFISIREQDYNRSHMTLSNLEKYVRECAEYYSTWDHSKD